MHVFTFSCEYQCSHLHDDKCGLDGHILWHAQATISLKCSFLTTFYNLLLNVKTFVSSKLLPAYVSCSHRVFQKLSLSWQYNCQWPHFLPHSDSYSFGLLIFWCFNVSSLHCIKMIALLIIHFYKFVLPFRSNTQAKISGILRFYICPVGF